MKKNKVNFKNLILTTLAVSNLILLVNNNQKNEIIHEKNNIIVKIDEEAGEWYSLYKNTLNEKEVKILEKIGTEKYLKLNNDIKELESNLFNN